MTTSPLLAATSAATAPASDRLTTGRGAAPCCSDPCCDGRRVAPGCSRSQVASRPQVICRSPAARRLHVLDAEPVADPGAHDAVVLPWRGTAATRREQARRAAAPWLPHPGPVVGRLALALLEIEAGHRSAWQLRAHCRPEVWDALNATLRRHPGPLVPGTAIRSIRCQEHTPGLVEGVAVVRRGGRTGFVAMRLDGATGRWLIADLQRATPAPRPR